MVLRCALCRFGPSLARSQVLTGLAARPVVPKVQHQSRTRALSKYYPSRATVASSPVTATDPVQMALETAMMAGAEALAHGDYGLAVQAFEKATQLSPTSPEAFFNLGIAYQSSGDLEKAINCWERSLKLDPQERSDIHTNLAAGYILHPVRPDKRKALMHIRKAHDIDGGKDVEIVYNLAAILEGNGELEEAEKMYRKSVEMGLRRAEANLRNVGGKLIRRKLDSQQKKNLRLGQTGKSSVIPAAGQCDAALIDSPYEMHPMVFKAASKSNCSCCCFPFASTMNRYFISDELPDAWLDQSYSRRREQRQSRALFIDRLLELAGLEDAFPPASATDLERLLARVEQSSFGKLQQLCVGLYLAQDYSKATADRIIKDNGLPRNFVSLVEGYYQLDNNSFMEGSRSLSQPGVKPDFMDLLIEVLAENLPEALQLFLIQSRAEIATFESVLYIVKAYTRSGNVRAAFEWARHKPSSTQRDISDDITQDSEDFHEADSQWDKPVLIRAIMSTAFGAENGALVPKAVRLLSNTPYSKDEDTAIMSFVGEPPSELQPNQREVLLQWAVSRLISESRFVEAAKFISSSPYYLRPGDTETAKKRNILHQGLLSVMTAVDLSMLELEQAPAKNGMPDQDLSMDVDIAQHAWAPKSPILAANPSAKSLQQARESSVANANAALPPRLNARDTALSGSPAFKNAATEIGGVKATLAAMRAQSVQSENLVSASPSLSSRLPSETPRRQSPFVGTPRTSDISTSLPSYPNLASPSASRQSSPLVNTAHRQRFQSRLAALQRERPSPIKIDRPPQPPEQQEKQKRSPPSPREENGPAKVQALASRTQETPDRAESKRDQTPETNTPARVLLPGAFEQADNEDIEEDIPMPEMREVGKSPVSPKKARNIRGGAPEPPTPRRSARLSRSASVELGGDLSAAAKTKTKSKSKGRRATNKGKETLPEVDEED